MLLFVCAIALVSLRSLAVLTACAINFHMVRHRRRDESLGRKIQSTLNCILVFSIINKHLRAPCLNFLHVFFPIGTALSSKITLLPLPCSRPQIQFLCYTSIARAEKQCLTWLWRGTKRRNALKCRILHLIIISTTDRLGQLYSSPSLDQQFRRRFRDRVATLVNYSARNLWVVSYRDITSHGGKGELLFQFPFPWH